MYAINSHAMPEMRPSCHLVDKKRGGKALLSLMCSGLSTSNLASNEPYFPTSTCKWDAVGYVCGVPHVTLKARIVEGL